METTFYDLSGRAYAYSEDGETIYTFSGRPIAYFDNESIYAFNGNHIGYFENGIIYDSYGCSLLFSQNASSGPVKPIRKITPIKGIKHIKPIKGIKMIRPIKPIKTLNWSQKTPEEVFEMD